MVTQVMPPPVDHQRPALPPRAPELADLDLLLSISRAGSLGKAARAHGISQPAASARIRLLERRLGLHLLERSPSGSRLTPAGTAIAQWARRIIDATWELLDGADALLRTAEGALRVAASMTVAEYLLPRWLVTLRERLSELTVVLRAENSRDVVEHVRSGEVDIGFVEDPSPHPDLTERIVGSDELAVVVAPGHEWAALDGPITLDQLAAGPLVLREQGSGTRETLQRVLGELRNDTPHLELTSTTAIKEAVGAGAGAAVLSALTVDHELRTGQLVRVPVAGVELRRKLRATWRRDHPLPEPARLLVQIASHDRNHGAGTT